VSSRPSNIVSRATFWMSSFVVSIQPSDKSYLRSPYRVHHPSVRARTSQTRRPFLRASFDLTKRWRRAEGGTSPVRTRLKLLWKIDSERVLAVSSWYLPDLATSYRAHLFGCHPLSYLPDLAMGRIFAHLTTVRIFNLSARKRPRHVGLFSRVSFDLQKRWRTPPQFGRKNRTTNS